MSTYLQLCQDTVRECEIPGGGPAAVTGQTGDLERVVNWVKNAWIEIQNRHGNWRWMRVPFTLNTVADDDEYAYGDATDTIAIGAISRFRRWYLNDAYDPPTIYLQSAGVGATGWLTYIDWDSFKWLYRRGTQNAQYPAHISVDPQNNLVLGPKPDDVYVVGGDFYRSAQVLADDGDTPEMHSDFHQLIVYRAMERYAFTNGDTALLARAEREGRRLLRQLEADQLSALELAGPMA